MVSTSSKLAFLLTLRGHAHDVLDQYEGTLRMRNCGVIIDVRCQKKFNKFGSEEDSADSDVEWDA